MTFEFPCPCCGFLTFDDPPGSYAICNICDWEDDHVQLKHPLVGGANHYSLVEGQRRILAEIPLEVRKHEGFKRDEGWRPITEEEARSENAPTSGLSYFYAAAEESPGYYWRK